MPDLTPDDVARREFRTGFRGYETTEVRSFLSEVAAGLAGLFEERDRIVNRSAEAPTSDVRAEIEAVTSEVGAVLEAAHEAAAAIRERASADATRWRSEAVAEAESQRSGAALDAEALRSDAWTMSEQLLNQCQAEADRVVDEAKKEALRVLGEAEREAHRMQAASRREAEDVVRAARMEAERLSATAKARHDEMIDEAMKQSEAAQERTLALEKRRQELLGELESVRATLTQVEDALDQRRERLGLSPSTEAIGKVVTKDSPAPVAGPPADAEHDENWTPGETVRVVRPSKPGEAAGAAEITAQPPQPEVKVLSGRQFARIKAGLDPDAPDEDEEPEDANPLLDQREEESTTVRLVETASGGRTPIRRVSDEPPAEEAVHDEPAQSVVAEDEIEPSVVDDTESTPEVEPESASFVDETDDGAVDSDDDDGMEDALEPAEPVVAPSGEVADVDEEEAAHPEDGADDSVDVPTTDSEVAAWDVETSTASMSATSESAAEVSEDIGDFVEGEEVGEDSQQQLFGEVAGLFDRLRVDPRSERTTDERVPDDVESMVTRRLTASVVDPFEVRDRLLLPVGNRALRNLKRQLTEAQNVALEEIRLDESTWEPSVEAIRERVRADLVVLFAESFGAGHTAAEEILGGRVARPATPRDDVAEEFVATLTYELEQVVHEGRAAGQGARQLGASLSRVFRGWRTDQAERRVRDLSLDAYHQGLVRSLELGEMTDLEWKVAGRGCATCRAAGEERPEGLFPPAHPGCECTVGP